MRERSSIIFILCHIFLHLQSHSDSPTFHSAQEIDIFTSSVPAMLPREDIIPCRHTSFDLSLIGEFELHCCPENYGYVIMNLIVGAIRNDNSLESFSRKLFEIHL